MPKITFVDHFGGSRIVDAEVGDSLMRAAVFNDIPGIVAECGGACACATCHVYIEEAFLKVVNPPTAAEQPMLAFVEDARPNSRLSCQIEVTPELEGMTVQTPESQY